MGECRYLKKLYFAVVGAILYGSNSLWEYKYINFPSCNLNSFATGNILRLLYMGIAGTLYVELFITLIVLF